VTDITMPMAQWAARDDLPALVAALGADDCRFVGGCVRDALLGIEAADVDIATRHVPERTQQLLKQAGIRSVPTGIEHGTITALLPHGPVEITTLRKDVDTDGRRATVAFASEWFDDAARRDFTINALYAHPEHFRISDYFGGLADLDARIVRFIGDAETRIREDHLRILRYFRFQARFGSEVDDKAEVAIRDLASTLKGLSRERVAMELLSILALPDPASSFERMAELGVLQVILPEVDDEGIAALAALQHAENRGNIAADPVRRLAALLPPDAQTARQVASRLRLSNAQKKRIALAAARDAHDAQNPRSLAYRLGMEAAVDRLLLLGESTAPVTGWDVPQLPVSGGDIVAAGIGKGPLVARTLQAVEGRWIAEGFPDAERTRAILVEEVGKARM
jgi:poly(A) polymerase